MDCQNLTRDHLYDTVWKTPMCHLAKSYRVSIYTLMRTCDKFDIPRPGNDYWPLLRLGYTIEKTPLPPAPPNTPSTITIAPRQPKPPINKPSTAASSDDEPTAEQPRVQPEDTKLQLASDFHRAHPLVRAAKDLLEREDAKREELVRCAYNQTCLAVLTTKSSLRRGLLIADAVIRELERRGYPTHVTGQMQSKVTIGGDQVSFLIREKIERRERPPKPGGKHPYFNFERYTFHATGLLSFNLLDYYPEGTRRGWSDGKRQRLENFLDQIVDCIIKAGEGLKKLRLEREEWTRQWEERERTRVNIEHRRQQELARQNALEQSAERWQKAERLREFLRTCRHVLGERADMGPESSARRWIDWASLHADRIDPLRSGWLEAAVAALPSDVMRPIHENPPSNPIPP